MALLKLLDEDKFVVEKKICLIKRNKKSVINKVDDL